MNQFDRTPCNQPFDKQKAIENAHHHSGMNLERRLIDYERTINNSKHTSGFNKPGSNKK